MEKSVIQGRSLIREQEKGGTPLVVLFWNGTKFFTNVFFEAFEERVG